MEAAARLCLDSMSGDGRESVSRAILFVHQKMMTEKLGQKLDCHVFHAGIVDREAVVAACSRGEKSSIIAATSALGAGVDYPSVRQIVHVDAPGSLLEYAQEVGRAGRDPCPAHCTVLLGETWGVSSKSGVPERIH